MRSSARQAELDWLFDDAVAEPSIGRASGWRRLKQERLAFGTMPFAPMSRQVGEDIRLRVPVEKLAQLWGQRVHGRWVAQCMQTLMFCMGLLTVGRM